MRIFITLLLFFTFIKAEVIINKENLYRHIEVLTNTPNYRNFENLVSLDSAASYIAEEFSKLGYVPFEQKYSIKGNDYKNIIASVGPKEAETIVIGAHYDVCGDQPGADDNASGIAGLLEVARILKQNEKVLKKRFELVAYTLEEPPFFNTKAMGSYVHARYSKEKNIPIELMISIEMIGFFSDEKIQEYPVNIAKVLYPSRANYIFITGQRKTKRHIRKLSRAYKRKTVIKNRRLIVSNKSNTAGKSDHVSYQRNGFKALMITDTSYNRNKHMHTKNDTIDKLDFDKMSEVVKGLVCFLLD